MKKLLSILGVCGLVGMSANLTACDKPNNNKTVTVINLINLEFHNNHQKIVIES